MKVHLIGITQPVLKDLSEIDVIFTAMSQCYNEHFNEQDALSIDCDKKTKILQNVLKSGHESVVEHISFNFLVENVSRALTHQLVRHRIASFSQRSGRYTGLENGEWYVIPHTISKDQNALKLYIEMMDNIKKCYNTLTDVYKIPKEDARFILPNGQYTNIAVTMNCRALKNFFGLRLCTRAQWEIRELAIKMANICKTSIPEIFVKCNYAESKCVQNGFCTEPKKQWCHKMPHISDLNN